MPQAAAPPRPRVVCKRSETFGRWDCINARQRETAKESRFAACTSPLTSPATRRPPPKCGASRLQPRGSPLRQTGCWRKPDSNRRYRATPPTFRERLMSRLFDSPRRESRREREPKPRGEAATRCARCGSKASAWPSSPHPPASADRRDRGIPRDHLGTHLPSTTPCSRPRSSITFRSGSRTNRETCPLSPKLTGP